MSELVCQCGTVWTHEQWNNSSQFIIERVGTIPLAMVQCKSCIDVESNKVRSFVVRTTAKGTYLFKVHTDNECLTAEIMEGGEAFVLADLLESLANGLRK